MRPSTDPESSACERAGEGWKATAVMSSECASVYVCCTFIVRRSLLGAQGQGVFWSRDLKTHQMSIIASY